MWDGKRPAAAAAEEEEEEEEEEETCATEAAVAGVVMGGKLSIPSGNGSFWGRMGDECAAALCGLGALGTLTGPRQSAW